MESILMQNDAAGFSFSMNLVSVENRFSLLLFSTNQLN